jgi:hypothetical protein
VGDENVKLNGKIWPLLTAVLATALLTILISITIFGERFGIVKTRVDNLEQDQYAMIHKLDLLSEKIDSNFREFSDFLARLEERFKAHVADFERHRNGERGENR